ncbi:MAG TPA: protein phosphatase 2C domain-containing protein [Microbacteriaceae bacterium]|nr:protein phosphatase 2C domain-containing protein [Microbacteriaceae bacterium]
MNVYGTNAAHQSIAYTPIKDLEIELTWHAVTNVGLRRETNEDSYVIAPPLFAVADGMGGHAAGDLASQSVVKRLFDKSKSGSADREDVNEALVQAVDDIAKVATVDGDLGAGTTVTGITFGEDTDAPVWDVFNIGDSRVYQCFRGALTKITADHSVVQHLIDTGSITEDEAETHPHANVITRAVGFNEDPIPDYVQLALIPGQRILICSDGLTKEITDVGIQHFLTAAKDAEEAANELVEQALQNAGRDNITVIVVDVHSVGDDMDTTEVPRLLLESEELEHSVDTADDRSTTIDI